MTSDSPPVDRRTVLAAVGSAGATALAGCTVFSTGEDAGTTELSDDRAHELAEQFAPMLYFDENEKWFPTDPSTYESERDGETVVDGFDAFDGYTAAANDREEPPEPTLFYHAVEYDESPLSVVQF